MAGVVDREAPVFVVAEVLDAAERDSFVAVVALAGPGVHVAERPAPADGDFLQVRGIFGKPRSGRPAAHGPSTRLAVIAIAASAPPDVESQWSHALIASGLRKRGLEISPATTGRILADVHVRRYKVRAG